MPTSTHTLILPGPMIQRGFWLYVCRIKFPKSELLYVGRTGDESSANAAAPFARLGEHLAVNKKGNTILQKLKKAGVSPEQCTRMEMVACGPLFCETKDLEPILIIQQL